MRDKTDNCSPIKSVLFILYNELKKLTHKKNDWIKISCQMNGVDIFQRRNIDDY